MKFFQFCLTLIISDKRLIFKSYAHYVIRCSGRHFILYSKSAMHKHFYNSKCQQGLGENNTLRPEIPNRKHLISTSLKS